MAHLHKGAHIERIGLPITPDRQAMKMRWRRSDVDTSISGRSKPPAAAADARQPGEAWSSESNLAV
jgi:hypothetical protein